MGDMQVGVVANIDDKGFYGMMEDKPVVASSNPTLQVSVSFGRFENDSLSWEKFSAFSPNKYLEEVGKCATPGSVAQKKAYFEAHYKKIAERKAEIMDQEKQMDNKNASFRSVVTDQGSMEGDNGGSVTESMVDTEEDKHVTDVAAEVKELSVNEEAIVDKECQSSVDEVKEEVKETPKLENSEELALVEEKPEVVVHMQEKPEEVLQIDEKEKTEVRVDVTVNICNDTTGNTNETPKKEMEKEKPQKVIKKDVNVGINRTRNSPKPDQVRTKPTANKVVTSRKTPPSKEIKNMMKPTKKPAAPISKAASPGFSTPRVYKPASKATSLSTSQSSVKKENASSLLRNKQTAPKSLHMSMSLGPSASDPSALTSTRKSLIMERMGDKDIVKRAFKSFQKSYDLGTSVDEQKPAPKQNPAKSSTSIPTVATRHKENGRPAKASGMEKRISTSAHGGSASRGLKSNVTAEKQQKELSKSGARPVDKTRLQKNPKVVDAKTRRESLNPKAKPMQGSLPVRTLPKGSSDKML
ncbi:hypothetical protein Bca52824_032402 [Brassica carinata]|uniref:Protein WVD2-like 7 n=1 Tax=Brassica carinata TaxID=52824 RepID=A0A8X7V7I9_BRACI|nr:hypothetical protein Bca52824_032402 [Brassica carinata]